MFGIGGMIVLLCCILIVDNFVLVIVGNGIFCVLLFNGLMEIESKIFMWGWVIIDVFLRLILLNDFCSWLISL